MLNKRENYLRAVRRQSPQWVPMDLEWTPEMKAVLERAAKTADLTEYFGVDARILDFVEPWATWSLADASTAADVDRHPWNELGDASRYRHMAGQIDRHKSRGLATIAGGANFWENFHGPRGYEQFLMDLAEDSPVIVRLYECLGDVEVMCAEHIARSGADILRTSGDLGTQRGRIISLATFKRYILPLMRRVYSAAKRINPAILCYFHSCGDVTRFVPYSIEAGSVTYHVPSWRTGRQLGRLG